MSKQMPSSPSTPAAKECEARSNIVERESLNLIGKDRHRSQAPKPRSTSSSLIPYYRDNEREQDRLRRLYGSHKPKPTASVPKIKRNQLSHLPGRKMDTRKNREHRASHSQNKNPRNINNRQHCCNCQRNIGPSVVYVPVPNYNWTPFYVPPPPFPMVMRMPVPQNPMDAPIYQMNSLRWQKPNMQFNRDFSH